MYTINKIKERVTRLILFFPGACAERLQKCFLVLFFANMSRMYAHEKTKGGGGEFIGTWTCTETSWRPSIFLCALGRPTNKDLQTSQKHICVNTIVTFLPSSTDVVHLPSTTLPSTSVSLFCSCGIGSNLKSCFDIAVRNEGNIDSTHII